MRFADLLLWPDLIVKMVLTAAVVVAVSIAVERSGPLLGALLAALPTAAGAAYVVLAFEHPPAFVAASAVGSAAATAAVSIFALAYTLLAQRHGPLVSVGLAVVVFLAAAAALRPIAFTALTAAGLNVAVFAITVPLSWRYRTGAPPPRSKRTFYDIPGRALSAAIVVAFVTGASYSIGPFASGLLAVFPVVMCASAVILQPRVGGRIAASMFAHAQVALNGLWLGFLAVHVLVAPVGVWGALALGLAVCASFSGVLYLVLGAGKAKPA